MASGGLALEGGDPRRPSVVSVGGREIPVGPGTAFSTAHKLHDANVSFEEYIYHARVTRADNRFEDLNPDYKLFGVKLKKNRHGGETLAESLAQVMGGEVSVPAPETAHVAGAETQPHNGQLGLTEEKIAAPAEKAASGSSSPFNRGISDDEYTTASRALRTAGWSSIFFLITTDILGPFNVPQAVAYMGYGPAVALYTVFGFFAGYGGFLLWRLFMGLDSDRYPVRVYGDLPFRIYGNWARHLCNVLQFIQLFMNVGIIIVQNGLSLEQIIVGSGRGAVCFVVLCLVWAIAGMLLGQIRTLKNIGWLANVSIWLNLLTIFIIMGVVAHSDPNYDDAITINGPILGFDSVGPIQTWGGAPPGTDFSVQVEGLQLAIFAFGGAVIFVELMAEMRRPFDFWKGMICAQLFIYFFYLLFGIFVYSYQGQYTINPAYQSISPYSWQTVCNAIQLVTSLIAALLYGNVGLKVAYNAIGMDLLGFPDLNTRTGKFLWVGLVPVYWGLSFIVGAAIPQVTNLSALLAAVAIIQFSYTFPPILQLGYMVKRDSMLPGDGFVPTTGQVIRGDSGVGRYWRGFKKNLLLNSFHAFLFLGSLVTCGLGIYAAIEGMITAYATGVQSSFSCTSPYG